MLTFFNNCPFRWLTFNQFLPSFCWVYFIIHLFQLVRLSIDYMRFFFSVQMESVEYELARWLFLSLSLTRPQVLKFLKSLCVHKDVAKVKQTRQERPNLCTSSNQIKHKPNQLYYFLNENTKLLCVRSALSWSGLGTLTGPANGASGEQIVSFFLRTIQASPVFYTKPK